LQWNTIPIGTLHPLDTAGKWESGTFDSLNPDGTTRTMAPLTLSGERQDGAVASDARHKRTVGLLNPRARLTSLMQLHLGDVLSTPVSKVRNLSPKEQKLWADHVLERQKQKEIFSASPKQVLTMTGAEQKLWAEHTLQEYQHRLESKRSKRWATQVEKLLHLHNGADRAMEKNTKELEQHDGQRKKSSPRGQPRALDMHKVTTLRSRMHKAAAFDTYGFPELKLPSSIVQPIQTRHQMSESLRTNRKCDKACIQLAQSLVRNQLPV
jgi:hypothetical protein